MVCTIASADRRRKFWVTQPDSCGDDQSCGVVCGKPGLKSIQTPQGVTFATTDYVRGLAINILLTNGRKPDSSCGTGAGYRGGHWSDAFRTDGQTSGSLLRQVYPRGRISENIAELQAAAQRDLEKLVVYGVATSVDVSVVYKGRNVAELTATILGQNGQSTKVGVSGVRLENSWVWNS